MSATIAELTERIAPLVQELGYRLWGLELGQDGSRAVLRIYIDAAEDAAKGAADGSASEAPEGPAPKVDRGVDVEDCAKVSRNVGLMLEVEDPFAGRWNLEVSSPGLQRPFFALEQMAPYVGQRIEVQLSEAREGRRHYKGELKAVDPQAGTFVLAHETGEVTLDFALVARSRLLVSDWDAITHHHAKPGKSGGKG